MKCGFDSHRSHQMSRFFSVVLDAVKKTTEDAGENMTVAELIKKLEKMPQDVEVVTPGHDHSYSQIYNFYEAKAEVDGSFMSEYHDELMFGGEVKIVVVLE